MERESVIFQHTVAKDGDRGDGPSILYLTKEVNFMLISLDDPALGTVVIAYDSLWNKDRMVEAVVQMSQLPPEAIIELASTLSLAKDQQTHRVEAVSNGVHKH